MAVTESSLQRVQQFSIAKGQPCNTVAKFSDLEAPESKLQIWYTRLSVSSVLRALLSRSSREAVLRLCMAMGKV